MVLTNHILKIEKKLPKDDNSKTFDYCERSKLNRYKVFLEL